MDCDDVIVLLAREGATLTGVEETRLHDHVAGCESCRKLQAETDHEDQRWIARLPEDAFDDPDLLVLPVIDPVVFTPGKEIASGGMGRITRARDRRLGRDVAIKEMLEPELRARFEREAMITARLQHPAIVPIYEAGTWPNGSAFYTMRLVSGGTLAHAIDATTTFEERLVLVSHVVAVTDALAYAHANKIIHRDLKPHNVLVGEFGETVVIDWGLAKELGRDVETPVLSRVGVGPDLTMAGSVIGTPCFMPPEQARGDELDERADVFALGAILYNVLTGDPPYWDQPRDTPQQLVDAALQRPPTPIAEREPRVPADLRAIVERAMARDPADRYPAAREMAEELRRFQAGQLIASRAYGLRELVARWVKRHRAPVIVGSIAALVLAVVAVVAVVNVTRSRDAEHEQRLSAESARATADTARRAADTSVAALLEEQGRSELVGGDRERAFAYLAEAFHRGRDTVALRHLLVEASRDLGLLRQTLPGRDHLAFGYLADGRLATASTSIEIWDRGTRVAEHPIDTNLTSAATFGPGALRLATVERGRVTMWDVLTGKQLWTAPEKGADGWRGLGISFDPSGKLLLIVGPAFDVHREVELRDVDTGARLGALEIGTALPYATAFSTDGEVAVADSNSIVHVWSTQTRTLIAAMKLECRPEALAFLTKRDLVIGCYENEAQLWKIGTRTVVHLDGHYGQVDAIAISDDLIATGDTTGALRLWTTSGELVGEASDHPLNLENLAFTPDGRLLLGGGRDHRAYVWDTESFAAVAIVDAQAGWVSQVAWAPDGASFAASGSGREVRAWSRPAGRRIARIECQAALAAGTTILAADRGGNLVVYDADGRELRHYEEGRTLDYYLAGHLQPTSDGRFVLAVGAENGGLYDLSKAVRLATITGFDRTSPPTLTPDGRFIVTKLAAMIRVSDPRTGRVVRELAASGVYDAALSPDGTRVVAVTTTGVREWDVATGTERPSRGLGDRLQNVQFARSGRRFVLFGGDAPVVVDDARTVTLASHTHRVEEVALDDAGTVVAMRAGDGSLTLANSKTGASIMTVDGVGDGAFAITRDGTRLATADGVGTVRIWDCKSARLLEIIHAHHDKIDRVTWTADGTRIVVDSGLTATIWDVHLETRPPAEIAALAERSTPWIVVDGQLVARASSPSTSPRTTGSPSP